MRLLSDFDGVWTHPEEEGAAQAARLDGALLATLEPAARETGRAWLTAARRTIAASPTRYGWAPGGRISAFADEDPFAPHSALLHYLRTDGAREPTTLAILAGLAARGEDLESTGLAAHLGAVSEVEAVRGPAIVPAAAAAGRALLAGGVDVVVVSNSVTDKLARWLGSAGLPTCVHPERTSGALRLRGDARKFELDPSRHDPLALGALEFEVARPAYEAILREEAPDAVVGDVFSIDLALPLALKRRETAWRHVRLFWLVHDYSPARMRTAIATHAPEVEALEDGLAGVANALLGSARTH